MGGMDDIRNKASEYAEKAKGARRQGSEQADEGMQRAGRETSERSGGRHDEQAQRGQEQARRRMGDDSHDDAQDDWS
ncbi:Rv0909 family putative TA system antitoxin [Streptomyces sp. NPDC049040]|uniref:Rv0909 family putative TA system antitoxin n=1 Tax=Streptomyces sp. NPDC049040 TaxID=3365593 RepID=UPI00371039C9